MELSSKILETIAFNTRAKIEAHMLIVMDKSTHEEHLAQSLQTNNKQFQIAVTFLTGYNGSIMLQIQIIHFISRSHLLTKILFQLLYHKTLTR